MVQRERALCPYAERLPRGLCHGRGAQSHDSEQPCPLVSWFSSSAAVHPDIPAPLRASFWDLSVFIATTPSSPIPFSEKSGSPASGSPFLGAEGERGCQP